MSSGHSASHVVTISDEHLAALCPKEHDIFMRIFDSPHVSENAVAQFIEFNEGLAENYGGDDDVDDGVWEMLEANLQEAWALLSDAFRAKTKVGGSTLELWYGYHDPDIGDCYDDVDGPFWGVEGVRVYSPAGEALKEKLADSYFVTYG